MSNFDVYYYTWPEVCQITTLSESTIRKMQPKGTFPWHEELSDGRVGFPKAEIHLWLFSPKAWKLRNLQRMRETHDIPVETIDDSAMRDVIAKFWGTEREAGAGNAINAVFEALAKMARNPTKTAADNPTDPRI